MSAPEVTVGSKVRVREFVGTVTSTENGDLVLDTGRARLPLHMVDLLPPEFQNGAAWTRPWLLGEVAAEIKRSEAKHGDQSHLPDGTWLDVVDEWREAFAERDPVKLRAELIQVAAVAAKWVAAIDWGVNVAADASAITEALDRAINGGPRD